MLNSNTIYSSHITIPDRPPPKPLQSPEGEVVFNCFLMILVWEDCEPSFARAGRAAAQAVREQSGARDPPVTPWLVADAASGFGTTILRSHGLGRIPLHHFRTMTGITDHFVFSRCHRISSTFPITACHLPKGQAAGWASTQGLGYKGHRHMALKLYGEIQIRQ